MKKILIVTLIALSVSQASTAWELHTFNSRKTLEVLLNIPTPQECESKAKAKWDEYKRVYSSWEQDHMQFNTWCTAKTANKCYEWVIKCPNVVCTVDKIEGKC